MRIYQESTLSQETAEGCYAAFLLGQLPREGALIAEGPHVYLYGSLPPLPAGEHFSAAQAEAGGAGGSLKAAAALRAYREGRRLPAGVALAADGAGAAVMSTADWEADLSPMDMFHLSYHPLDEVVTPQEAAKLFHTDPKRVQRDCETAGAGGVFAAAEARKSGSAWLLLTRAAARVYGGRETAPFTLNPLLLVFSTVEAAYLWNRDSGVVRSAAAGAGHAAARMNDEDRRKSGRTWLVQREAMERLFGQAVPGRMKEALAGLSRG